ncbi:MmcQ/YjbR family DNA-binding protein [Georgenia halophila]|uniref:MmcQ/YjbR family DNA-binding protein n=2 Tax=Georgenia halophila TaxID=620889 RepID=A0ABP8L4H6_9MICO
MFDDDDPYLVRLRRVALEFPDAEEQVGHGRPQFRAGASGKVFAVYGSGTKGPAATRVMYPHGLVLLPDEDDRLALAADPRVFVPAYYVPSGWIGIDLADGGTAPEDVDWQEIAELLDASYRQVAGRSRVARLDADGGPAARGLSPA